MIISSMDKIPNGSIRRNLFYQNEFEFETPVLEYQNKVTNILTFLLFFLIFNEKKLLSKK